jgi:hypothetical protein
MTRFLGCFWIAMPPVEAFLGVDVGTCWHCLHDLGVLLESKAWPPKTCQAAYSTITSHDCWHYQPSVAVGRAFM